MSDVENKRNLAPIHNFQEEADKINAKKKKSSTGKNPESLSLSQKQAFIASWLNNSVTAWMQEQNISWSKQPAVRFMLLRMRANKKSLYKVTPEKEVIPSTEEELTDIIGQACHNDFYGIVEPTDKIIQGCASYWHKTTPLSTEPKLFAWADSDDLALRRLPCVYGHGPTPYWDKLLENFTNSIALQAFIGSLLEEDSYMQQYVWIYGEGNDGKGTLLNFLSSLLGGLHQAESVPQITNRFWLSGFKDDRLVSFSECEDPKFILSALFKSLLGGDMQRLEDKFGKPYSGHLMCKFIFCSNQQPQINSEISNIRRIIYCQSKNLVDSTKPDTTFGKKLWEERGYIISKCLDTYRRLCPNHEPIPHDRTDVLDLAETNQELFEAFLKDQFNVGPNLRCEPEILAERIHNKFKTFKEQQAFRNWLKNTKKIIKKTESNSSSAKKYFGLSPKYYSTNV
jgi:hypothetical protein